MRRRDFLAVSAVALTPSLMDNRSFAEPDTGRDRVSCSLWADLCLAPGSYPIRA